MPSVLTCPRGHRWESAAASGGEECCPQCGRFAEEVESAQFSDTEPSLPPPPVPLPNRWASLMAKFAAEDETSGDEVLPRIPGYEVLERIGRGGMGVVYRAREPRLQRTVAIKLVQSNAGDSAAPRRLQREAESIARLQHPHIVQVFAVGECEGRPYLVLELLEGGTLARRLNGSPLPHREAAELVAILADAMQYAHERGVLHRDLKPSNVLLTARGEPKIADFGLAKQLEQDRPDALDRTGSQAVLGTPGYMAPEQTGIGGTIGPPTDVYALGAILYELLVGRPPFRAATPVDTIWQVRHEDPVPPRRLQPRVPADLETICGKCLHKNPSQRYATAVELADDLRRFLAGRPIHARATAWWEHGWKWARRHPAVASLAATATIASVALLLLGVGAAFHSRLRTAYRETLAARDAEADQRRRAESAKMEAENAREHAEQSDYRHQILVAHVELDRRNPRRAAGLLDEIAESRRGWEWGFLHRLARGYEREMNHPSGVNAVAFHPKGKELATACGDPSIRIWDRETGALLRTLDSRSASVLSLTYSEDGLHLAAGTEAEPAGAGSAQVWSAETGSELVDIPHRWPVHGVRFDPSGKRLATACGRFTSGSGEVSMWDLATGQRLVHFPGSARGIRFSPDGRTLAAGCGGTLRAWDTESGKLTMKFQSKSVIFDLDFSPDGRQLAFTNGPRIALFDLAGRKSRDIGSHRESVLALAFSPDGERIVASSGSWHDPHEPGEWKVWNVDARVEIRSVAGHTGSVPAVALSRDGKWLASGGFDRTLKLWDMEKPADLWQVDKAGATAMAFSPDGTLIATGGRDRMVRLWDTATHKLVREWAGHAGDIHCVAFSPAGTWLASAAGSRPIHANADNSIRLWNHQTGEAGAVLAGHDNVITSLAFHPAGALLVSSGLDHTVRAWNVAEGRLAKLHLGHESGVYAVAFAPDGQTFASASDDRRILVWRPGSDAPVMALDGHADGVRSIAYSHDGRYLVSGCRDGAVIVWDLETRLSTLAFRGHEGIGTAVAISPMGNRIASAGQDHWLRVWDRFTGHELLALPLPDRTITRRLAYSPSGQILAAILSDGRILLCTSE